MRRIIVLLPCAVVALSPATAGRGSRAVALRALNAAALTPGVLGELNELPAFVHCNPQGAPLQYERDGQAMALFYADIDEAREALASNRRAYPDLGLRIVAIGLGEAYERRERGEAVVVPGAKALDGVRREECFFRPMLTWKDDAIGPCSSW